MEERPVIQIHPEAAPGNVFSYVIGFLLSLLLTLAAYILVYRHVHSLHYEYSHAFLRMSIASLAIAQLLVQLIFFLHLGRESKPRWNLLVFGFALSVVVIVVFGSLWIMNNLDYNMQHMTPQETNTYLHDHEGL